MTPESEPAVPGSKGAISSLPGFQKTAGALLCPREENRYPELVIVPGAVALGIVHSINVDFPRAERGIGHGGQRVAAVADGRHYTALAGLNSIQGHAGECRCHHSVHEVRTPRTQ